MNFDDKVDERARACAAMHYTFKDVFAVYRE
jgi:hypothetical protein